MVPLEPPSNDMLLEQLESVIQSRRTHDPNGSYVADLLAGQEDRLLKKIGEEAGEVMLAAKSGDRGMIAAEVADLLFHLLVLLARYDLKLDDVQRVLQSRRGRSRGTENNVRTPPDYR